MSNTRTAQRRVNRGFAQRISTYRRNRFRVARDGTVTLRPLQELGGTRSPYYRPAPVSDRQLISSTPRRIGRAIREGLFAPKYAYPS